jgi:hypothetical protein
MIGKVEQQQPTIFYVLQEWQSFVVEFSYNIAKVGSFFNQQKEKCHQILR